MEFGDATIHLVSDGSLRMDGGSIFGIVPKAIWSRSNPPDRQNRIEIALNCLLIQSNGKNILVDTGIGDKHNTKVKTRFHMHGGQLRNGLEKFGLSPDDIDIVVLTHLHFDHVGGCTTFENKKAVPVFRNATHLVQQLDWDEANNTNERTRTAYIPDDFLPLQQSNQLQLLDGDTEIISGLWVRRTGGHTAGHQLAYFESGGEKVATLGDVLMIPEQIPIGYTTSYDLYPMDTFDSKRHWISIAQSEQWLVVFGHSLHQKSGYLSEINGRTLLNRKDIT
jgi:glyoxylase-like metal-dependent hydrolase (beta-lactamase superfamily II)